MNASSYSKGRLNCKPLSLISVTNVTQASGTHHSRLDKQRFRRDGVEIEKKLNALGYQVPNVPSAAGNYIGCVRVGNLLFVGGNTGRVNGVRRYNGKVGSQVTLEHAYEMARDCAL